MVAEIRAEADADRVELENELEETVNEAWDEAISDVRAAWAEEENS